MRRYLATAVCLTLAAGAAYAAKLNKEQKRLQECGVVMQEVSTSPTASLMTYWRKPNASLWFLP